MPRNTKKLTILSLLLGISLIIFILEAQLPPLAPIPGIKPGLANIITLIALCWFGKRDALLLLLLRILLGGIFTGTAASLLYSLSGGLAAFFIMALADSLFREPRPLWIISILGAVGHNAGQIGAAIFVTGVWQIAAYFPALLISAVITGLFTGVAAAVTLRRCPRPRL